MAGRSNEPSKTRFWDRFSDRWWAAFFLNYENSGLRSIQKGSSVPSSTPFDITSHPLPSASEETHASVPDNAPSTSLATSLHIRSESIKDTIISSSPITLHASHIPSAILDVLPLGQAVECPAGTDAQLLSLSAPSQSELPIRSNDPLDNTTTPSDSVIDIRPPESQLIWGNGFMDRECVCYISILCFVVHKVS